jgi:hypothetical protein
VIDNDKVDRSSPVGYRISSVAFNAATGEPVVAADSHDSLTDILINKDNMVCPDNCFRPVGLAFDDEGRLWMSSDSTGEIYVLQRTGEDGVGRFVQPGGGDGGGDENAAAGLWARETMVLGSSVAAAVAAWLVVF